jgi:hypothetical protein
LEAPSDPYSIFLQVAGHGHWIENRVLLDVPAKSAALRTQLSRSPRSFRYRRQNHGDRICLTHEFLNAGCQAAKRNDGTACAGGKPSHSLGAQPALLSETGLGLEAFAKDADGPPEAEYRRLFGQM